MAPDCWTVDYQWVGRDLPRPSCRVVGLPSSAGAGYTGMSVTLDELQPKLRSSRERRRTEHRSPVVSRPVRAKADGMGMDLARRPGTAVIGGWRGRAQCGARARSFRRSGWVSAIGSIGDCTDEPTAPGILGRRSSSVLRKAAARCFPDWSVDDRMGLQTRRLGGTARVGSDEPPRGRDGQNSDTPQEPQPTRTLCARPISVAW